MSKDTRTPPQWRAGSVETRDNRVLPSTYNADEHTVEVSFGTGAAVSRWWGTERLEISEAAINAERVEAGQAKVIDSHNADSIRNIIASILSVWVEGGELRAKIKFVQTDLGVLAEGMVARGELTGLSVGYTVEAWAVLNPDTAQESWVATEWTILEGTFCAVPADLTAKVRAVQNPPVVPPQPEPKETRNMDPENETIETPTVQPVTPPVQEVRNAPTVAVLTAAETIELQTFARSCGVETELNTEIVKPGMTKARGMEFIRSEVAKRQAATTAPIVPHGQAGAIIRDSRETEGQAIGDALVARMSGQAPSDKARSLMGYRILDLMALRAGINSRDPMDIMQRAQHTSSDFPLLLEAAANKVLLDRYKVAEPTYRRLAKKVTFNDFKPHKFLRIGDFPALQDLTESGEIKAGTIGESREQATPATKGVILMLTRQMLINDDLSAFADIVQGAALEAGRTENSLFFTLLLANAAMSDTVAMFHANHGNLATGAAISVASMSDHRAKHRKQKGLGGQQPLNIPPSLLLCGPDKETEAEQILAPTNQNANEPSKFNPFSGKLLPVCDALVTGNQWYTLANPDVAPQFIYGYVGGTEGPQLSQVAPFNIDGFGLKMLHDFGVGQIDFRNWVRNAGN